MARRNKRASMREGPLADLFRSTGADAPADPPEAPGTFFDQEEAEAQRAPEPPSPAREEPVVSHEEPAAREPRPDPGREAPVAGGPEAAPPAAEAHREDP